MKIITITTTTVMKSTIEMLKTVIATTRIKLMYLLSPRIPTLNLVSFADPSFLFVSLKLVSLLCRQLTYYGLQMGARDRSV
jgi:hypothetical protein